ncbi:tetratricopeptide repeat protein [Ferruginibacter profundus]
MKIIPLIFSLSLLTACNNKQAAEESTRLSKESKTLIQNNKLAEALQAVEKSIQLDPTNYAAYNNRAYINSKMNKPAKEVLADYYKALSINPGYDISLFSLTNYYFSAKNYDSTIARANIYLLYASQYNFDKKQTQHIYAIRGESEYMLGGYDAAIPDINKAIELDSADAGAYKLLGDCYLYKDSVDRAIKAFTTAIQLNSNYYQAYLGRAKTYEKLNTAKYVSLAAQDYKTAFIINPLAEDIYATNSPLFKKIKQVSK